MFSFKFKHSDYSDKDLNESIFEIIDNNTLLSMATVSKEGKAHINTAFYAYDNNLNLYIITDPKTKHSINLLENDSVAATIYNSRLKFWEDKMQGLQLFGKCYKTSLLQLPKGTICFIARFPVFKELVTNPEDFSKAAITIKLYTLDIKTIKLFDETRFGEEVFIELEIKK